MRSNERFVSRAFRAMRFRCIDEDIIDDDDGGGLGVGGCCGGSGDGDGGRQGDRDIANGIRLLPGFSHV